MTMTNQKEKRLRLFRERQRELRVLAEGRKTADVRYVRDVVDWFWAQLVERKLRMRDSLPRVEQRRLDTLIGLSA
jgi:hypothetical protein